MFDNFPTWVWSYEQQLTMHKEAEKKKNAQARAKLEAELRERLEKEWEAVSKKYL